MADNPQNPSEITKVGEDSAPLLPKPRFFIPLQKPSVASSSSSSAPRNASAPRQAQEGSSVPQAQDVPPIHILLIADYPDTGTLIANQLRDHSYQVTTVDSGEEALAFLGWKSDGNVVPTGVKVDLILTDNQMTDRIKKEVLMSGLVFLQTLKNSPMLQEIPVILFSLDLDKATTDRFIEEGAAGYMSKLLTEKSFMELANFFKKVDRPNSCCGKCCFL